MAATETAPAPLADRRTYRYYLLRAWSSPFLGRYTCPAAWLDSEGLARMTAGIALPTAAAPQDKRRAPRIAREGMIMVFPFRHGAQAQGLRARFKDVSAQGIGLILQQPLQAGDQFVVRLPRKDSGDPAAILYTVVRCERKGEHEFRIGAELVCVMGREPVPGKKAPDDRRNLERIRRAILSSN